ncbi:Uncharacterized protein HZ326_2807 [Fusarium oxysporum f. sp. albedinis]|nr:Uncharacterized protein HZ326_2807 [Fusarium oxysporum f. sp. albedinis]
MTFVASTKLPASVFTTSNEALNVKALPLLRNSMTGARKDDYSCNPGTRRGKHVDPAVKYPCPIKLLSCHALRTEAVSEESWTGSRQSSSKGTTKRVFGHIPRDPSSITSTAIRRYMISISLLSAKLLVIG